MSILPPIFIHKVTEANKPKFVKPARAATYSVGDKLGKTYSWEYTPNPYDTVHILVNNTDNKQLLLVQQVRIPVLINTPSIAEGITAECCAGLIDGFYEAPSKKRPLYTAMAEVLEELGYDTIEANYQSLPPILSSVGSTGSVAHLFYAEVTNNQLVGTNFGDDEFILPLALSYVNYEHDSAYINDVEEFLATAKNTTAITKYLLSNFQLNNIKTKL